MKKFKTTREKELAKEEDLKHLLAEKNLLKNVFLDYSRLPVGVLASLLMLLVSFLAWRPLTRLENMLFVYQGIGMMCFFYTFQAWYAYQQERQRLKHTRNAYIGRGIYPLIFGALFIYLLLPLNLPCIGVGLLALGVALVYPLKVQGKALKDSSFLRSHTVAFLLIILLTIPLLAPGGQPTPMGLASVFIFGVLFAIINQVNPALMHVDIPDEKTSKA